MSKLNIDRRNCIISKFMEYLEANTLIKMEICEIK